MYKLLLFFFMLFSLSVSAQLSLNLTPTEALCTNDGQIQIQVSNGTQPYVYTIAGNGNTITRENASANITESSLAPGEYTVTVTDSADPQQTIEGNVIIAGDYTLPEFTLTDSSPTCATNNDAVLTAEVTSGRSPYTFKLYEGAYDNTKTPIETNQTGEFTNLAEGDYSVQMIDACDNAIVVERTIFRDYNETKIIYVIRNRPDCETTTFRVTTNGLNNPPYKYRIVEPSNLATPWQDDRNFTLTGVKNLDITFEVEDGCGTKSIKTSEPKVPKITETSRPDGDCGEYELQFKVTDFVPEVNYTVTEDGSEILNGTGESVTVFNAKNGSEYNVVFTDACGDSLSSTYIKKPVTDIQTTVEVSKCEIDEAQVYLKFFNGTEPVKVSKPSVTLTQFPSNYSGDTEIIKSSGTSSTGFLLDKDNNGQFVAGDYAYELFEDGCPTGFIGQFTVEETDILRVTLNSEINPGCTISSITSTFTANVDGENYFSNIDYFILYDDSGTEIAREENPSNVNGEKVATFSNLSAGTYYVDVFKCNDANSTIRETIVIADKLYPKLTTGATVNCESSNNLTLVVEADSGVPPYEYRIIEGPGITPPATNDDGWQTETTFEGLTLGTGYRVQIRDQCGTIVTEEISKVVDLTPAIDLLDDDCENGEQIFRINKPLPGATYSWSFPDGTTANGTVVSFPVGTSGQIVVNGELGTCASGTTTYEYNGQCAQILPLTWVSFNATQIDENVLLSWETLEEVNTSHFEVQRSLDGINWSTIGQLPSNNAFDLNEYSFVDKFPATGNNLYRINQVDLDGRYEFSKVISITFDKVSGLELIRTNPVKDVLSLNVTVPNSDYEASIYTLNGKLVTTKVFENHNTRTLEINTNHLVKGLYLVVLKSNGNIISSAKFVKM